MMNPQKKSGVLIVLILSAGLLLAACGTPSTSIGYRIPGTGVSVGVSVPLDKDGNILLKNDPANYVWRNINVSSEPAGAEIYVNGELVGATPSEVSVPFDKASWGRTQGSALILLKKPGYLPDGFRVFPAGSKSVSLQPNGPGVGEVRRVLRGSK